MYSEIMMVLMFFVRPGNLHCELSGDLAASLAAAVVCWHCVRVHQRVESLTGADCAAKAFVQLMYAV
jgi:hypothetical protein